MCQKKFIRLHIKEFEKRKIGVKEKILMHEGRINMDLFYKICEALPKYPKGNIWATKEEILCRTESAAETVADLIEQMSKANGKEVLMSTGFYDPEEDKRNNEEDERTGWYYIDAN